MTTTYAERRAEALSFLEQGDAHKAFGTFRWTLEYPAQVQSRSQWCDALTLLSRIGMEIAGKDFASLCISSAKNIDSPQALYDLGYELVEQGLHGIAASVLARALGLAPTSDAILSELGCALGAMQYYAEACKYLKAAPEIIEESAACRYLLANFLLFDGDSSGAEQLVPELRELITQDDELLETYSPLVDSIEKRLARAHALAGVSPVDWQDLRGWHYVVHASLLLHVSSFGFNEGMNGRYAFVLDTEDLCLEGLQRLDAVLKIWGKPPRVYALPGRDNGILARAASRLLDLPLEPWQGSSLPGLMVAYDLCTLSNEELDEIRIHRPGQILFSHATCWTEGAPVAADLTTFLYQTNSCPWGQRLRIDQESRKVLHLPPDTDSEEVIAERVLAAKLPDDALSDLETLVALATAIKSFSGKAVAEAFRKDGERPYFSTDSYVKSSRF